MAKKAPKKTKDTIEEAGVKAIIALQKAGGIIETKAQALKGWRAMSPFEQQNTMAAFKIVCGG